MCYLMWPFLSDLLFCLCMTKIDQIDIWQHFSQQLMRMCSSMKHEGGGVLFLKHSLNFCIFMGPREWLIAWLSSTCCDPICHLPLTIPKNDTLLLYLTSLLHQMLSLQIKRTTLFGKCSNLFLSPPVPCLACALFVLSHGSSAHVASRAMKECNMSTFYRVDLRS